MTTTRIFQSNRSQALRLPRDVAFPADVRDVVIRRDGRRRVVVPVGSEWDDFFAQAPIDLPDRDEPALIDRDDF